MKKPMLLAVAMVYAVVMLLMPYSANAQEVEAKIRHMKGFQAIKVGTAKTGRGFNTYLGYDYYFQRYLFVGGKLLREFGKFPESKFSVTGFEADGNYMVYNYNDWAFVNVTGAMGLVQETTKNEVFNKEKAMVYYIGFGLNTELYISNTLSVEVFMDQNAQGNSNLGKWFFQIGLGVKYNF
jgi:hydrogenase/urease accessory protein HupE